MSSGGGNSTTTTKVQYSPQEQIARDYIMREGMQTYADAKGANNGEYTGAKPIPASGATQAGWQSTWDAANTVDRNNAAAQGANDFGLSKALYASSNPYLQDAMNAATKPMIQQFTGAGGPMSQIRNTAIGNGTYGSSRQGLAEGTALTGLMQKVGDVRATMSSDAYTKGLDVQQNAIKNQAMLNMMAQLPSQMRSQVGASQEGYQQQQENYNAASRDYARNSRWEPLQNMANVIYGGSNGTTTSTSSMPKQDQSGQIAASIGMMALMAMMSDRRLKRNIVRIGTHARGFGIYLYTILGRIACGVMAQEVQKIIPSSVLVHPSGFLMVDYSQLEA